LATKDAETANRRAKAVLIEFDHTLERAEALLAERPKRDNLTDAEIKLIADYHYAERLHDDEHQTREGTGQDAFMLSIAKQLDDAGVEYTSPIPPSEHPPAFGLSKSDVLRKISEIEFLMPIMKHGLATGDVSKVDEYLDYLLNGQFGVNLDTGSEAP
jgi:hypothetical protein